MTKLRSGSFFVGVGWLVIWLSLVRVDARGADGEESYAVVLRSGEKSEVSFQVQGVGENELPKVHFFDLIQRKYLDSVSEMKQSLLPGVFEGSWKGPEGVNLVAAMATKGVEVPSNESFEEAIEKPKFTGEFAIANAELDYREDRFEWDLARPALVRPIVTTRSGLPLARPAGWQTVSSGRGGIEWDFRGSDGFDYSEHPFLVPYLQMVPLPSHWGILSPTSWSKLSGLPEFQAINLPDGTIEFSFELLNQQGIKLVSTEEAIEFPFEEGLILRVVLSEESLRFVSGRRFEILVYFDGEFVHEESQGVSPFLYVLPSKLNGEGRQLLSVNVLEYGGNWGTRSLYLDFERMEDR